MNRYTYGVNGVDILPTLVSFSSNPMSVQIGEQTIDVVCAGGVSVPFGGIVS